MNCLQTVLLDRGNDKIYTLYDRVDPVKYFRYPTLDDK